MLHQSGAARYREAILQTTPDKPADLAYLPHKSNIEVFRDLRSSIVIQNQ